MSEEIPANISQMSISKDVVTDNLFEVCVFNFVILFEKGYINLSV